jgi:hypothetical protein
MNHLFSSRSRRGISSVVGALIFTVLMIAGFSTMSLALDSQTDIVNTQLAVADTELKKQQEQFGIAVSTDANNILNVLVDNKGQNPVEISRVWITNKTLATQPAKPFSVNSNDAFVPSGFTSNVLSTLPLYMMPDTYDVKVISTLGTVRTAEVTVGSGPLSGVLRAELITDPPDVIIGQNVTVAMLVTNTGSSTIENVVPGSLTVTPPLAVLASSLPIPSSVDLTPGESVLFSWDYKISGASGDDVTFSNYANGIDMIGNVVTSNTVFDTSTLSTDGSNPEDLIVLTQDLLAKPAIFTIIPGPFGDDNQQGLWGVNIVNPTAQDLYVSKIVFTASSTRATGTDVIIDANSCGAVTIPNTPTGTWNCPVNNQLMWKNLATPALVPGYSSVSFLAKLQAGSLPGVNDLLETVPITVNVFSSLGQFGKAGYATSFVNSGSSVANVYLTDLPGSISNTHILSSIVNIHSGSTVKLNATLADFDTGATQFIDSGSRLIINIPKGWTNPTVTNAPGFNVVTPIQTYSDSSSQIVGFLKSDLTGFNSVAQTIEFTIKAPTVTTTQLYVMYILADGTITNDSSVLGPLAEVVLQVVP